VDEYGLNCMMVSRVVKGRWWCSGSGAKAGGVSPMVEGKDER